MTEKTRLAAEGYLAAWDKSRESLRELEEYKNKLAESLEKVLLTSFAKFLIINQRILSLTKVRVGHGGEEYEFNVTIRECL